MLSLKVRTQCMGLTADYKSRRKKVNEIKDESEECTQIEAWRGQRTEKRCKRQMRNYEKV